MYEIHNHQMSHYFPAPGRKRDITPRKLCEARDVHGAVKYKSIFWIDGRASFGQFTYSIMRPMTVMKLVSYKRSGVKLRPLFVVSSHRDSKQQQ